MNDKSLLQESKGKKSSRLKALGEGSKQWSSSAPNLGKSPKHTPIAPGFASLNEMGKRVRVPLKGRERDIPWQRGT